MNSQNISALIMVVLFPFFFVFIVVYLFLVWKTLRLLEIKHDAIWSDLGRPSLFLNNSMSNNFKFLKFLRKKSYLTLNDAELNKMANRCRFMHSVIGVSMFVFGIGLLSLTIFPF